MLYDRIHLLSRCGRASILNPLLTLDQMSPYIVPDHVLELNIPTSLTPTFWGALTIVPFDSLATDSPQSTAIFKNNLVPTSSKGSENTLTPLFEPVNLPTVRHHRLYFDDGNITFRVRLFSFRFWYLLIWRYLHRFRGFSIASIDLCSVADRGNSRILFPSFPNSKRPPTLT